MAENVNSYAENLAKLTKVCNDVLSYAEAMNETLSSNDTEVVMGDNITLPSYSNIVKRVERAENTISKFTSGSGIVETDDGTYRRIKTSVVSRPPDRITGLPSISKFTINPTWFFEQLQYPRCVVKIDLKGTIDDASDRVLVNRVILDSTSRNESGTMSILEFYNQYVSGQDLYYSQLISLLETYGVPYKEDEDEIKLPLTYEQYKGEFTVTKVDLVKDSSGVSHEWYFLSTLNYYRIDTDGAELNNAHELKVGDYLRADNSLYKISEIDKNSIAVRIEYAIGYENVGVGSELELYNDPFSSKEIEVGIGIDEVNIIYIKGVNEDFNLVSREWSSPISFYTNTLMYEDNVNVSFSTYYEESVSDFGKKLIDEAKERKISSYRGITPNPPVLNADELSVVQINTQLESTLDSETYNKVTSEIATTKSSITAIRTTIATNKDILVQTSDSSERENLQNTITTDTNTLNTLTTQYSSLVEELNTLLNDAGAINYEPKYHIRGFFAIPDSVYEDETNKMGEQRVIGFEIKYRYLHTDESGVQLNSYEYTGNNDAMYTGVFTDWNLVQSIVLSKEYDETTGTYIWKDVDTTDGTAININQIDIPIRNGEKVEIKARSISEAGYPYNPLKSAWSSSVIVEFPSNLTSDNSASTILEMVKSDMTAVALQQTLSAAGIYTHIEDSNSTYKHSSKNIGYSYTDDNNNPAECSVQDALNKIDNTVKTNTTTLSTHTSDILALTKKAYDNAADIIDINNKLNSTYIPDNEPLGIVKMFAGTAVPDGYLLCDGRLLKTDGEYAPLYNVIGHTYDNGYDAIGNRYSNDDSSMFRLPDLRGRFIVGATDTDTSMQNLGAVGGSSRYKLTAEQCALPAHSHSGVTSTDGEHTHTYEDAYFAEKYDQKGDIKGSSGGLDNDNMYMYRTPTPSTSAAGGHTHTIPEDAISEATSEHENRPPFYVLKYIIKAYNTTGANTDSSTGTTVSDSIS